MFFGPLKKYGIRHGKIKETSFLVSLFVLQLETKKSICF
jgi:hypothetical protein